MAPGDEAARDCLREFSRYMQDSRSRSRFASREISIPGRFAEPRSVRKVLGVCDVLVVHGSSTNAECQNPLQRGFTVSCGLLLKEGCGMSILLSVFVWKKVDLLGDDLTI